jgi:Holliday junction DNA helicase RuvB
MPHPAPRFRDFIGKKPVVDHLRCLLKGAMSRKKPFPHTLIIGPSGVGKTRLARSLAAEFGTCLVRAMGHDSCEKLHRKLCLLETHDFLFVDECHRLGGLEQEFLYEAIDSQSIPNLAIRDDQKTAEDDRSKLNPFTLVVATDQPGRLLNALSQRMKRVWLDRYEVSELKEIVETVAKDIGLLLSPHAARMLAQVSAGLPRKAKHYLQDLQLSLADSESRELRLQDVRRFLDRSGVDRLGLGDLEHRYLKELSQRGTLSLASLSLLVGTDSAFVKHQIEPILVRHGLVEILPAGRRLTDKGKSWSDSLKPGRFRGRGGSGNKVDRLVGIEDEVNHDECERRTAAS